MPPMDAGDRRIAFAELAAAGVRLRPSDAVAIVRELALQVSRGELQGIPSVAVIRLTPSGTLVVEGPVAADGQAVTRAAQLLDSLLPPVRPAVLQSSSAGDSAELRAPGALRLVVARALRRLDLPPFASLDDFVEALTRFAPHDADAVVRRLVAEKHGKAGWAHAVPPALDGDTLTVSDIRRARRATGLCLAEIAERSRIPSWLLRELEWGYFHNWPAGLYGRAQLTRYARAAGLDEKIIVRTIWPLLEEFARERGSVVVAPEDVRPADPSSVEPGMMVIPASVALVDTPRAAIRRRPIAAALSIAALLVIAMLPALWDRSTGEEPQSDPQSMPSDERVATAPPAVAPTSMIVAPAFASAGTAMFQVDGAGGERSILRITRVVGGDASHLHAHSSPDGTLIAFDSDREGERAVFVADADGRNVRRVTGDGFAAFPSWSPDGRVLAYSRAELDRPEVWNLWIVDVATGETDRLTTHGAGKTWGASWFPEGHQLAYSHEARLVVLDLATSFERVFTVPMAGRRLHTPSVSPDGRRVIVHVEGDGAWLLEVADGSLRRVLQDPSAEDYAWAPDSRRVAYHSRKSGKWRVWVMAPRSSPVEP